MNRVRGGSEGSDMIGAVWVRVNRVRGGSEGSDMIGAVWVRVGEKTVERKEERYQGLSLREKLGKFERRGEEQSENKKGRREKGGKGKEGNAM